jgi:hypothetical protein
MYYSSPTNYNYPNGGVTISYSSASARVQVNLICDQSVTSPSFTWNGVICKWCYLSSREHLLRIHCTLLRYLTSLPVSAVLVGVAVLLPYQQLLMHLQAVLLLLASLE